MTAWILNYVGLVFVTAGAMLIFLYLWKTPRVAERPASPVTNGSYARNRGMLIVAVGLLALWMLLQCLAVILL